MPQPRAESHPSSGHAGDGPGPACAITGRSELREIYRGPIRSGGPGSAAAGDYRVLLDESIDTAMLHPAPDDPGEAYATNAYWDDRAGGFDEARLHARFGPEQTRWFNEIGPARLLGRRVVDVGCGPGLFLDLAAAVAHATTACDLADAFVPRLEARGHGFVRGLDALEPSAHDVAVCFDTLEHIPDPVAFCRGLLRALAPGGEAWVGVPNLHDVLRGVVPEYTPFFFHAGHLWYFSGLGLRATLQRAGFEILETRHVHKYTIMNALGWALHRTAQGNPPAGPFDARTEADFAANLERQGLASHVLVRAKRPDEPDANAGGTP